MLHRLKQALPRREQLERNRWLSWLAPLFGHPRLWHWSRRGVALGVAIGVFFGLLIPLGQIPLSAATAVVLRANVPAAAASTLVTNPVTFAPIYYGAYHLGAWLTGSTTPLPESHDQRPDRNLWQYLAGIGLPLLVGLSIAATVAGLLSYAVISLAWVVWVRHRRRNKVSRDTDRLS